MSNPFRIVATLGPASFPLASALVAAGATELRLNASHLEPRGLERILAELRRELPLVPVVVDLQGAKMRLGRFAERAVSPGERVRFTARPGEGIPLPHPELVRAVQPGDTLSCDDARLRFRVLQASADALDAESLGAGVLRPRKGINLEQHPVRMEDLSETDARFVDAALPFGPVSFAFSFMVDGREAAALRRRAAGCVVVGKVERREATESLGAIAHAVDVVWICRGDLGAQLGPGAMARWVSGVKPAGDKPWLMAGQVLEHLVAHRMPTRSEVCHLFDLLARGYAGVVLSDETAVGSDPVNAVQTAASLARAFA